MRYKPLREWQSGFHNWVIKRHPFDGTKQNGFMGGFIFGERGTGKSTYCYKLASKIHYTISGYTTTDEEEESYKKALDIMMFDAKNLRSLLVYNKLHGLVSPIVVLDDASMHFGSNMHQTDPLMYSAIRADTATIRTAVTGFLINAPRRDHVAKCLRDYDDYKGKAIIDAGGSNESWNRKIRFYQWNYYPDEKKYNIKIPFQDKYSCYVPDVYHKWYLEKKRFYEIKYDMIVADKIDKETRQVFIENSYLIPSYPKEDDLHKYIDKWKKEEKETLEEKQINEVKRIQRKKKHIELYDKLIKSVELKENENIPK